MKISGIGLRKLLMSLGLPVSNNQGANRFCASSEERLMGRLELMTVMDLSTITPSGWAHLANGAAPVVRASGSFSGPLLSGVVLKNVVTGRYSTSKESLELVATAELLTHDGARIYKTDHGFWRGTHGAIEALVNGESVAASQFYFIGLLKYAVTDPRYAWLKEGNYLSHGANDGDTLKISQYRVLDRWNLAELADQVAANRSVVQAHLDR
jgi:Protein of unknown function (DUF3237)